ARTCASVAPSNVHQRCKEAQMNADNAKAFGRRDVLKGGGVLIVRFALGGVWGAASTGRVSTGRVELGPYGPAEDQVDSWIAIAADGRVTLFSGCSELGTGSSTGLLQIVAEELDVPFVRVKLMLPDTNRTPDQFVTSGSRTISIHSRPIRQAAAEARAALVDLAAKRLKVTPEQIITRDGVA